MKFAWIEEMIEGDEILQDGAEILDGEGNSFDPPQFEQIPFDPPVFEIVGSGAGLVTGLNRAGRDEEQTGNCTPQQLIYGMDHEKYKVNDRKLVPFSQQEAEAVDAQREADKLVEEQRLADLEARIALLESEKEADGLSKYTPDQVRQYIDNQIDNAGTAGEKLEVIKTILKKIVIYILKAE